MSILPSAPTPPRSPWQRLYAAVLDRRRRRAATSAATLPRPAISVGNLHWGGSGKTPTVIAIAESLRARDSRLAILSRGYGRGSSGTVVVSRGNGPEVDVERAGDEPWLLARRLPEVPVVVDGDRLAAARVALEIDPAIELFLLDDAFSHVRARRDLDLLVFPFVDPWGRGRLLPSGRLREPLAASRHADAALLTGVPATLDPAEADTATGELEGGLRHRGFRGQAFHARERARLEPSTASGPCLLVTGIARPERVVRTARGLGLDVVDHLAFPDHHSYPPSSLARIRRRRERVGAETVVTTTKDRVKLDDRLQLPLVELIADAELEAAFTSWLLEKVEGLVPGERP